MLSSLFLAGGPTANGLLVSFAVAASLVFACLFAVHRRTIDHRRLFLLSPFALFFGFVFARVFYVAFNSALFLDLQEKLALTDGGYSLFGAMFGAAAATVVFFLLRGETHLILPALDAIALGGAMGIAIGRWGNLLSEECFGDFIQSPALQRFPFAIYVSAYDDYCAALFFWESLLCMLLFVFLFSLSGKALSRPGAVLFQFLTWYCCARILTESMRQDSMYIGFVRVSQVIAALTMIALFIVLTVKKVRLAGFRAADLFTSIFFAACVGCGFWAEFYMGSDSRAQNLLLLAAVCLLMGCTLTLRHASYLRISGKCNQKIKQK